MQSYGNSGIKLILSQTAPGGKRGGGGGERYKVRVRSAEVVYERELKNIFVGYAEGRNGRKVIISTLSLRHVTLSVSDMRHNVKNCENMKK